MLKFLFPVMYDAHEHQWTRIGVDCVGCSLCGVVHVCGLRDNIVPCSLELQEDSSMVCTLTGIVIKTTTLYDGQTSVAEYQTDSIHAIFSHSVAQPRKSIDMAQKTENIYKITAAVVELLFFSAQARNARHFELVRYNRKIKKSFADHMSKSRTCFRQSNVLDAVEACMRVMRSFRKPVLQEHIPPKRHFECVQRAVVILLSKLNVPRPYLFTENSEKVKNLIVSMLYVCRDGISYENRVYLPKVPLLARILPLELALSKCFDTQPKIVTDGENIIKMCIKNTHFHAALEFTTSACEFEHTGTCSCPETNQNSMPRCCEQSPVGHCMPPKDSLG